MLTPSSHRASDGSRAITCPGWTYQDWRTTTATTKTTVMTTRRRMTRSWRRTRQRTTSCLRAENFGVDEQERGIYHKRDGSITKGVLSIESR